MRGTPIVSDAYFQLAVEERHLERKRMAALVHWDGWAWNEVIDVPIPDMIQKMKSVR